MNYDEVKACAKAHGCSVEDLLAMDRANDLLSYESTRKPCLKSRKGLREGLDAEQHAVRATEF